MNMMFVPKSLFRSRLSFRFFAMNQHTPEPSAAMEKLDSIRVNVSDKAGSTVNMVYYDSNSDPTVPTSNVDQPVVLAASGTPGSHKDFKYMVPYLTAAGYRVIIPNWPGHGITDPLPDRIFGHKNAERAKLLANFIQAMNLNKIDVIASHSAGCYTLPLMFNAHPNLCSSAIFIAPGGITPHKGIRPYWFISAVGTLVRYPILKQILSAISSVFCSYMFGMKFKYMYEGGVLLEVVANFDFKTVQQNLDLLNEKMTTKIVLACGGKDALVERAKSIEYAEKLHCAERNRLFSVFDKDPQIDMLITKIMSSNGQLEQHAAVIFEDGHHFVQKHEAKAICRIITAIIDSKRAKK